MPVLHFKNRIRNFQTRNSLLSGLVDYWTFDSNANTSTTSGNTSTISGVTNVTAKINNGYSFTGSNYIRPGTVSSYNFMHQTARFSISLWMKLNSYNADAYSLIMANNSGTTAQTGFHIGYENRSSQSPYSRAIRGSLTRGVGDQAIYNFNSTNTSINDNNWHHLVFTSNSQGGTNHSVILYIDGVKNNGSIVAPTYALGTGNASNVMNIGLNNPGNLSFNGILDEIGIWNRALMFEEVRKLYNAGTGIQYPF